MVGQSVTLRGGVALTEKKGSWVVLRAWAGFKTQTGRTGGLICSCLPPGGIRPTCSARRWGCREKKQTRPAGEVEYGAFAGSGEALGSPFKLERATDSMSVPQSSVPPYYKDRSTIPLVGRGVTSRPTMSRGKKGSWEIYLRSPQQTSFYISLAGTGSYALL